MASPNVCNTVPFEFYNKQPLRVTPPAMCSKLIQVSIFLVINIVELIGC